MTKPACAVLVLALSAGGAAADVWDDSSPNDDLLINTPNLLIHGSLQVHDLGVRPGPVADTDYYALSSSPYSSYEFLQDGSTGGVVFPTFLTVERVDPVGTVQQSGNHLGGVLGWPDAISMPWENATGAVQFEYIRVTSTGCGTSCTSDDQYRAVFYETTYSIPRFNNFGGQVTILIVQNLSPGPGAVTGHVHFWSPSGALLASEPIQIVPRGTLVLNTSTVAGVAGASGSITISHRGRYGEMSGKTVAVEPATGFSFDTPMLPKPR